MGRWEHRNWEWEIENFGSSPWYLIVLWTKWSYFVVQWLILLIRCLWRWWWWWFIYNYIYIYDYYDLFSIGNDNAAPKHQTKTLEANGMKTKNTNAHNFTVQKVFCKRLGIWFWRFSLSLPRSIHLSHSLRCKFLFPLDFFLISAPFCCVTSSSYYAIRLNILTLKLVFWYY